MKSISLLLFSCLALGGAVPTHSQTLQGLDLSLRSPTLVSQTPEIVIDLNRAKNYARQAAEEANGGLGLYQAEPAMHGPALQAPHVDNGNGSWTFTFVGGRPGWTTPTIESVVTVIQNTGQVVVNYNGFVRNLSTTNTSPNLSNSLPSVSPINWAGIPYRRPVSPNAVILQQGAWQSSLELIRLVNNTTNALAVDFNVLNQPTTTYANAVYQIYGYVNNRWVNIYTNTGARLLQNSLTTQRVPLEIINIRDLKLPSNVDLEDLRLKSVVQLRYDGAEGRDRTVLFERIFSYSEVMTYQSITQFEQVFYGGVWDNNQWIEWDRDNDDDDRFDRDDDDDDRQRSRCNQGRGNGSEGCDPGNSRPHGGSNDGDDDDDDDDQ